LKSNRSDVKSGDLDGSQKNKSQNKSAIGLKDLTKEDLSNLANKRKSLESIQIEKLTQNEWVEMLIESDLSSC
jgi:hypothetical protein